MIVTLAKYKEYLKISASTLDTQLTDLANAAEREIKSYLNQGLEWASYPNKVFDGNGKSEFLLREAPIHGVTSIYEWDGDEWDLLVLSDDYERLVIPQSAHLIYLQDYIFPKGTQNIKISYYAGYTDGDSLTSGSLTLGKSYRITASDGNVDFTSDGAADSEVGTEFFATSATITLDASNTVIELYAMPDDIKLACKELVKVMYDLSPLKNSYLGLTSFSKNAGGSTENYNIDTRAEEKILKKIGHYKYHVI